MQERDGRRPGQGVPLSQAFGVESGPEGSVRSSASGSRKQERAAGPSEDRRRPALIPRHGGGLTLGDTGTVTLIPESTGPGRNQSLPRELSAVRKGSETNFL